MMKKFVLVFGVIISIVFAGNSFVEAQSNFDVSWSAVNISKDNANAITNGVRPGDVVRYEVVLTGGAGPGNSRPEYRRSRPCPRPLRGSHTWHSRAPRESANRECDRSWSRC